MVTEKANARRRAVVWSVLAGSSILAAVALVAVPTDAEKAEHDAALNRWLADSAVYAEAVRKWERDSVVVDSVARTVQTDSLRRLYRAAARAADPGPLIAAIFCEQLHLTKRYGANPALRAIRVAESAGWSTAERRAAQELGDPTKRWHDESVRHSRREANSA